MLLGFLMDPPAEDGMVTDLWFVLAGTALPYALRMGGAEI
jgi:hypothetical protein